MKTIIELDAKLTKELTALGPFACYGIFDTGVSKNKSKVKCSKLIGKYAGVAYKTRWPEKESKQLGEQIATLFRKYYSKDAQFRFCAEVELREYKPIIWNASEFVILLKPAAEVGLTESFDNRGKGIKVGV